MKPKNVKFNQKILTFIKKVQNTTFFFIKKNNQFY